MVSIIVPTYNCSPWIGEAMESVINQTYKDWELIVVDDGSEDGSYEKARGIAEKDSRIRCFQAEHGGVARVRNIGIENASGEYIAFLDGDDIWPVYHLEYLMNLIGRYDAGISSGRIVRFADGTEDVCLREASEFFALHKDDRCRVLTPEEAVGESLYQKGVESSMSGKVFRRELFDGLKFKEGEIYEDLNLFYRVVLGCGQFVQSETPVYYYRQRSGSIVHTFIPERLIVLDITRRICEYMEKNCPALLPAAVDRRYSANYNMLKLLNRHLKRDKGLKPEVHELYKRKERECRNFILAHSRHTLFDSRIRRKNRMGALTALLLPSPLFTMLLSR